MSQDRQLCHDTARARQQARAWGRWAHGRGAGVRHGRAAGAGGTGVGRWALGRAAGGARQREGRRRKRARSARRARRAVDEQADVQAGTGASGRRRGLAGARQGRAGRLAGRVCARLSASWASFGARAPGLVFNLVFRLGIFPESLNEHCSL